MDENDNHPHHQSETLNHDDGYEADWLKWRSRLNRRHRFQQQASAPPAQEGPRCEDGYGAPEVLP